MVKHILAGLAAAALVAASASAAGLAVPTDTRVAVIGVAGAYDQTRVDAWNVINPGHGHEEVLREWEDGLRGANEQVIRSGGLVHYKSMGLQFIDGVVPPTDYGNPQQALAHTIGVCASERARVGASLFVYMTNNLGGNLGNEANVGVVANAQPTRLSDFVASAGCVVAVSGVPMALMHGLGHLGGLGHNQQGTAALNSTEFPYAKGIVLSDGTCDVMSIWTGSQPPCARQKLISGAKTCINGKCYGNADSDNVRMLNESRWLVAAYADEILDTTPCIAGETAWCVQSNRFRVEIQWVTAASSGMAHPVPYAPSGAPSDETVLFWFFGEGNAELVVKVLNACGVNGKFWVYSGGLTDQAYHLVVTDTLTGRVRVYKNDLGTPAFPLQDTTAAFDCN